MEEPSVSMELPPTQAPGPPPPIITKPPKEKKTKKEPKVPKVPKLNKVHKDKGPQKPKVKKIKVPKVGPDGQPIAKRKYKKRAKLNEFVPNVVRVNNVETPVIKSQQPSHHGATLAVANHLTTKDILDLVFLDHNYCQVLYSTNRSKVQPFRHLFGPKDEYKAMFVPETLISPNKFLPPVPPPPPVTSKLEFLLKRGNNSGSPLTSPSKRCPTPTKKYWEAHEETVDEIDVDTVEPEIPLPYDAIKARNLMSQCEKHAKVIKPHEDDDNWEDQIVKTGWTKEQAKLYDSVITALHSERLARLSYEKHPAEPVLRRASLDRTSRIVRRALHEICWSTKLTQWLHGVLIENLSQSYMASYLDVLQTLKGDAPDLVDRMILLSTAIAPVDEPESLPQMNVLSSPNPAAAIEEVLTDIASANNSNVDERSAADTLKEVLTKKATNISADALNLLLKKPWDPFSPVVHHTKMKKLACNPVFLYIPCIAVSSSPSSAKRYKNFCSMFAALGKVITLNLVQTVNTNVKIVRFAAKALETTKSKITEIRKNYPDRPLYLIGWGTGSILAATASVTHPVDGVIALAFPLFGLSGPRGTLEDPILDMKHPVLFIIGGRSPDTSLTDMELLRKQLNCETSMVVIGSGDQNLRINRYHREKLLVTQAWVDKCIVDEIGYFINLHSKHQQVTAAAAMEKSGATGKLYKKSGLPKVRTTSISSNKSVDTKTSCPSMVNYGSDCSMDGSMYDGSLYDDTEFAFEPKLMPTPPPVTKTKRKTRPYVRKSVSVDQGTDSGNSSTSCVPPSPYSPMQDTGAWNNSSSAPCHKPFSKSEVDLGVNSPVLNYLKASPSVTQSQQQSSQGGLLHGLLSPTCSTSASDTDNSLVLQNSFTSASVTPKPITKPTKRVATDGGEKKKRQPKSKASNKKPKAGELSSMTPAEQIGATVLAGGATATPVPVPVNTNNNMNSETMRQYVIQHQQIIQKHLHQYQVPGQQSQLLRLLSPPIPTAPVPYYGPPGCNYAGTTTVLGTSKPLVQQQIGEIQNIGLPPDLNIFPMRPMEVISKENPQVSSSGDGERAEGNSIAQPPTAMISRQQLMSNLTTPLLRLSRIDPSGNPVTGGELLQQQPPPIQVPNMPNFTPNARANVFLKAADKTIATNLRQVDLKALFDGGVVRFVVPGDKGQNIPVNIILKQPLGPTTTTTVSSASFEQKYLEAQSIPKSVVSTSSSTSSGVTYSVLPQEAISPINNATTTTTGKSQPSPPLPSTPVVVSESSQAFGQIFRSPVDSGGVGNSQVPVSVLMPKTFIAKEQDNNDTSKLPSKSTKEPKVQKMASQISEKKTTENKKCAPPLVVAEPSHKIMETPKISSVPQEQTPATTTITPETSIISITPTSQPKFEAVSAPPKKSKLSVVVESQAPIQNAPKENPPSQAESNSLDTPVIAVKTTVLPPPTIIVDKQPEKVKALENVKSGNKGKSKSSNVVLSDFVKVSKEEKEVVHDETSKQEDQLVFAVKTLAALDTSVSTKSVVPKEPIKIANKSEIVAESAGQVTRSLRPKSYPGPKRKRQPSGPQEARKKSKIVSTPETPNLESIAPPPPSEMSQTPSPVEVVKSSTKKRDGQRGSVSSEGNGDESVTPRLTRSMRRQSSNSGN